MPILKKSLRNHDSLKLGKCLWGLGFSTENSILKTVYNITTLLADSHMSESYFLNVLMLIDLGFEVLTMRKWAQNQDILKERKFEKKLKKKRFWFFFYFI